MTACNHGATGGQCPLCERDETIANLREMLVDVRLRTVEKCARIAEFADDTEEAARLIRALVRGQ